MKFVVVWYAKAMAWFPYYYGIFICIHLLHSSWDCTRNNAKSSILMLNTCFRIWEYELWFVVGFEYTNKLRVKYCSKSKTAKYFDNVKFPVYVGVRPTSLCHRTESIIRWKEGSVHVPNCKSFLVTEAERKNVSRRARFQQHRDASCHQIFSCKARRWRKFTPFWQKH